MAEEHYDITEFVADLGKVPEPWRPTKVGNELERVKALTVRDAAKRFQQQMYVARLERLLRHLKGEDVSKELTPTERAAHQLLAPTPAAPAAPETPLTGKERRQGRRIQMRTRAMVRAGADKDGQEAEVLEPVNVSRGGISFESDRSYVLHDIIFVTLHYQPGTSEMETRGIVVRAVPMAGSTKTSYGRSEERRVGKECRL